MWSGSRGGADFFQQTIVDEIIISFAIPVADEIQPTRPVFPGQGSSKIMNLGVVPTDASKHKRAIGVEALSLLEVRPRLSRATQPIQHHAGKKIIVWIIGV